MKAKRRKPDTKLALRIARAQLRAIRGFTVDWKAHPSSVPLEFGVQPKAGPPQFIQLIAVQRGMSGFLHALDSAGQVWERCWRKPTETTPGESWWELLNMERRTPKALDTKEEA